jgi:hypothetical protein
MRRRAERGRGAPDVFVPQTHLPGREGAVDFGEIAVRPRGELVTCRLFDEALCLYGEGWSLRAVGQRLDVTAEAIRRLPEGRARSGSGRAYSRWSESARPGTTNERRKIGRMLLPVHR